MITGIITGTGLQAIEGFTLEEEVPAKTPWGEPSAPLQWGQLHGSKLAFINRHGPAEQDFAQKIPPHRVNYRANLWALREAGAERIIAVNVVGAINGAMLPGHLVIPHQIIDYTWGRGQSYSEGGAQMPLQHVDFTHPYDDSLRNDLAKAAKDLGYIVHTQGVHGITQGPRLETAAEVDRLDRDGCDIVGMTGMPEAALARELDLPYACLALVVNPAAGRSEGLISMQAILDVMSNSKPKICQLLARVLGPEVC